MPTSRQEQIKTVLYMLAITAVSTAAVAAVSVWTRAGIEANERRREVRGAFDALGVKYRSDASAADLARLEETRLKRDSRDGLSFYRGYDEHGEKLIGYVFPIGGAGFWGPIRGYVALDTQLEKIIGLTFVRHTETPGLGARITEEKFQTDFIGKSILPTEGSALAIRLVQEGKGKGPGEVDAITGATGTSRAVERFLNQNFAAIRQTMGALPARQGK